MKTLLLTIACCFYLLSFSQSDAKIRKKVNKNAPPGTVWIKDSVYMDKTEIRNVDYRHYILWLKGVFGEESEVYINALPDTLVWRTKLAYSEPYVELYFRHPAYQEYPVAGVSYEQAVDYCKWRTDRVNEWYLIKDKKLYKEKIDSSNYAFRDSIIQSNRKVVYRLPTKEEWEVAARGGLKNCKYPWGGHYLRNYKGCLLANFNRLGDECIAYNDTTQTYEIMPKEKGYFDAFGDCADMTAPVVSYTPNEYGLYCMSGNMAEMVAPKGIVKGGSWKLPGYHLQINLDGTYKGPSSDVGFRCICEVLY